METLVNLAELSYEDRVAFTQTLIDAGYFSDIQALQTWYLQGYKSDLAADLYAQWQGFSQPIAGAPNWNEFQNYVSDRLSA